MERLPEELLLQIISYLDKDEPPSQKCALELPDVNSLFVTDSPLKSLSSVTRLLRRLILPLLFRHIRVNLDAVLESFATKQYEQVNLTSYPEFEFLWEGPKLADLAITVTIYGLHDQSIVNLSNTIHKYIQWLFTRILRKIDHVIVIAPPKTLAMLLDCEVSTNDAWAFNIDYQRVDLVRSSLSRAHGIRGIEEKYLLAGQFWDEFRFHGHSCLPSYGTYHYFEKYPPCPFTAISPQVTREFPTYIFGYNIVDFSYSVLFPHAMHFRSVVYQISLHFNKLNHFRLRLAPDPDGHLWQNLDYIGRGSLNLRDCWSEIEHCHDELIKRLVPGLYQLKSVKKVTIYDAKIPSIASQLDTKFGRLRNGWTKADEMQWERQAVTTSSTSQPISHMFAW